MALAAKVRDDEIVVIDDLAFTEPQDQGHGRDPQAPGLRAARSLLVATAKYDANVYRSARNIAGVSVSPAGELNALSVLSSRRLLVTKAALDCAGGLGQEASRTATQDATSGRRRER